MATQELGMETLSEVGKDPTDLELVCEQSIRIAEALLFASPTPVSLQDLKTRLPTGADAARVIDLLTRQYRDRGVHVQAIGDGFLFRVDEIISSELATEKPVERHLNRAQLEVLSIIAYHQPITRLEIEKIRGAPLTKAQLENLLETGWIDIVKLPSDPKGSAILVTTQNLLDALHIESLNDLPGLDEMRLAGLIDTPRATPQTMGEMVIMEDRIEDPDAQPGDFTPNEP